MLDHQKLQQAAKRRGVLSAHHLKRKLVDAGYETSDSQVSRLWNGIANDPKLSTVDRLCEVLRCKVSDITSV